MKARLIELFRADEKSDPDFQRTVIALQIIALVALAAVIFVVDLLIIIPFTTWVLSIIFILVAISLVLATRGILGPGRILVPISLIAAVTAIIAKGNGMHDTAVFGFPVILLLGSALVGRKGLFSLVLLCCLGLAYVTYGEIHGLIEGPYSASTGWDDLMINSALLATSAVILNLLMKRMDDTLLKAQQNEQALLLSEERFRTFMDTSPAIVIMKDEGSRYVYCNKKAEIILNKPVHEIIGKTEFDLFPREDAEHFTATDHEVIISGIPITQEYSAHDPRGALHYWWVTKFPMYDSNGKAYVGMQILDITERKKSEKERERSEEMYRRAIITAGAVPYYLDHRTRTYTFMGEGILQMTGYTASEMHPDLWESLEQEGFPRGNLAHLTYEEADQLTEEDGSIVWECDYRIRTRTGETRWVADTSVKGLNEFGERVGVIGILQDITDRKMAEIEREKLIKDLEARNAELERFTYTVSHDLKSPLVTIKGYLGYIENDIASGNMERAQKDLKRINDATERMQALLNDLLELSRIGRMMNPPIHVAFAEIVEEALHNVMGQIESKKINLHISPDLPTVHVDKPRLVEVIQNLIDNACKYMGDQPEPRIEIGHKIIKGQPAFYVRDNGIGIEPQFHERIFGLFNKLNPTSEGTGIGLALVKRIIEVHGGKVWVESDGLDKGSAFYFTLPGKE